MTVTQFCALLLWEASYEIPIPEFNRHWLARKHLLICLRGIGAQYEEEARYLFKVR